MKKTIKTAVAVVCLAACVCGAAACGEQNNAAQGTPMNETFFNPLRVETGMGDPWMYEHDGYYYYMHSEGTQITLTRSKWMTQVTASNDETVTKVIARQKAMNLVEIWAPEIFFFENHWYIYFTATIDKGDTLTQDGNRRTYCLKSKTNDAMGEWEQVVEVKLPADERSIDATFMEYNDKQYIIWAGWPDNTAPQKKYWQDLYITELVTGDPTKAKSLEDDARVMLSTPTYDWEKIGATQNEGPAVVIAPDGTPVILYSGAFSGGDSYCIGYVTLTGDMDPMTSANWVKNSTPLMSTDLDGTELISPGHNSVVKSPDGTEDWICYHSAKMSGSGWDRMMRLQKLDWENGHVPTVDVAHFCEAIPLPSGEKVNRRLFEAEAATLTSGCVVINATGEYNGKTLDRASNGRAVSIATENDKITFSVDVPENGQYLLQVRFSNTSVNATEILVNVNGTENKLFAPKTEYRDQFIVNGLFTGLYKRPSGANEVTITCDKDIHIDCIIVDYLDR